MSVTMQANRLFFVLAGLIIISCRNYVSEEELKKYILNPENGLTIEKNIGALKMVLNYRPVDLVISRELKSRENYTKEDVAELKNHYNKYSYFILTMSDNNREILTKTLSDNNLFAQSINNLAFGLDAEVRMITSEKDTVPVSDFVYPRMYGTTDNTQLMIVFPSEKIKTSDWVEIEIGDMGLGLGINKFRFESGLLLNIPEISFN